MRRRLLTEQGGKYSRPPNNAVAFAIAIGVVGGKGAHYVSAAGMSKVGMELVVSPDNVWESPGAMGWVIILYDRLIQARCCLK